MDFSALSDFLKYGPLGLAGLLLVLTIYALVSKSFDEKREPILTKILYVGALCFIVACVFAFLPQHFTGKSEVQEANWKLEQEKARSEQQKARADQYEIRINKMDEKIKSASALANKVILELNTLSAMQGGKICSGGSSGVPAVDAPRLQAKTAEALNNVGEINNIVTSLLK